MLSFSGITAQKRLLTHPGEYIFSLLVLHFIAFSFYHLLYSLTTPLVTLMSTIILFTSISVIAFYDMPPENKNWKDRTKKDIISAYCYIMPYLYGRVVPTSLRWVSIGTSSYPRSIFYGLRWDHIQYTKKYMEYPVSRILNELMGLYPGRTWFGQPWRCCTQHPAATPI